MKLARDLPVSEHQAVRRTNDRIARSFFFSRQLQRVKRSSGSCNVCQLRARKRRIDTGSIKHDRRGNNFGYSQADLIGPIGDVFNRLALTARNVIDKLFDTLFVLWVTKMDFI